ncbi:MAG TPA: BON domain-containing protein [Streptosporangiaceae bacterium]|nr:BON domain-containing protein [Streptosporangiaceae bacterium]
MSKTKDVRAAVEKELGFDPRVDSSDINVMTIGGNVNLTGTVPSFPQYLQASAAARRVAGVTSVENNLEVVLPESDYRDDVKLTTAANNALAADVTVPDSVEAIAEDGNVTLTGTVSYGTERDAAAAAVAVLEIHAPLRGAAVGHESWVPPAVGVVRVAGGRGFRDDRAAAGGVEGAQLCRRAVRRRRLAMDR